MRCHSFNVLYIEPIHYCGRFCAESEATDPCTNHMVIDANFTRTFEYMHNYYEYHDDCETMSLIPGWYRYSDFRSIPTEPAQYGQCGSMNPVWLDGSYPIEENETSIMKACIVNAWSHDNCWYSFHVTAKRCHSFNVVYLPRIHECGRFCVESKPIDPCTDHTVIEANFSRTFESMNNYMTYHDDCETMSLNAGWYRYSDFRNIPTEPAKYGQCSSWNPVWLNGSYPTEENETSIMTACIANDWSDCWYNWNVTAMRCHSFNVVYLEPIPYCGRFCAESESTDPCTNHMVMDANVTRTFEYIHNYYEYQDDCETKSLIPGWYRYSDLRSIPTVTAQYGQCGSWNPVWLDGSYPTEENETSIMKACIVNDYSDDCWYSWDVTAMRCHSFNIVYLTRIDHCGRFCLESNSANETTDQRPYHENSTTEQLLYYDYSETTEYPLNAEFSKTNTESRLNPALSETTKITPLNPEFSTTNTESALNPTLSETTRITPLNPEFSTTNTESPLNHALTETTRITPLNPTRENPVNTDFSETITESPFNSELSETTTIPPLNPEFSKTSTESPLSQATKTTLLNPVISVPTTKHPANPDFTETMTHSQLNSKFSEKTTVPPLNPEFSKSSTESPFSKTTKMTLNPLFSVPTTKHPANPDFTETITHSQLNSKFSEKTTVPLLNPAFSKSSTESPFSETTKMTLNPLFSITTTKHPANPDFTETITNSQLNSEFGEETTVPPLNLKFSKPTSESPLNTEFSTTNTYSSFKPLFSESTTGPPSYLGNSETTPYWEGSETTESPLDTDYDPCVWHHVEPDNFTRTFEFTTDYYDTDICETMFITAGWYRYDNFKNIPTVPAKAGQCGSRHPIWINGSFPNEENETAIVKGCIVDDYSDCWYSWNLTVMKCHLFYVFYIEPIDQCGRFCLESSPNTTEKYLNMTTSMKPTSPLSMETATTNNMTVTTSQIDSGTNASEVEVGVSTSQLPGENKPSTMSMDTTTVNDTFVTTSQIATIDLHEYINYVYAQPIIPTYEPDSDDRQLMFECYYYISWYYRYYMDTTILQAFTYDIKWDIDNEEFLVKQNIQFDEILTQGRLKSSEWSHREKKMGINIKCGIRLHNAVNTTYIESYSYFAGLDMWPNHVSISSGESALVYIWTTVPVACRYNDTNYPCKITLDLFDFNEQFTSGAPMYCNNSVTELTKPSMCGLELDGWQQWSWQTVNINLPENSAQDQEYVAKVKLRVTQATDDNLWSNYQLPEVTVNVVNDNVTDDYWWWYGWCFTGTDPWFLTFDWQWYDFHDQGEFVLYRHKTKPIEVHTIQRRYESYHTWTEHCAIAIRAASDVFIIYGCGKPTKWIIRRLNCAVGNEYLEVYSRWGGYEIALPTGSRVYVWISMNRRLNAYITLSRTDRHETEGLCGTWNGEYNDDFTGSDGKVYDDPITFARTWRVPARDSLFMAKERTEKLSQSFMYCSCLNSTQDGLSPNVDCSWKETMPVCPPLNWNREPCSVRSKRSIADDDDVTIDVSPDMVAYTEGPNSTSGWKNGWNESSAWDACNSYFNESILFAACSSLSNVNASSAITNCIQNIQVSGTDEYMADSFEMFKTQCTNEIRTNNTIWSEDAGNGTSIGQLVAQNDCPYECKYNGIKNGDCIDGYCNCYADHTGDDCRINMNTPPSLATELSNDSLCDTGVRPCNFISVFGENFYITNESKCQIENAEIVNNEIKSTGTYILTIATMENMGEVKCSMTPSSKRRKRSTSSTVTTTVHLVSVTNNGVNYSDPVPVILYDSSCNTCTTSGSYIFCQLRSDVCVISGICYDQTSSECSTTTTNQDTSSSSSFNLWIIGIVISGLMMIIIVLLLFRMCTRSRRPVTPMVGRQVGHVQQQPDIYDNSHTRGRRLPAKPTKINVKPAQW